MLPTTAAPCCTTGEVPSLTEPTEDQRHVHHRKAHHPPPHRPHPTRSHRCAVESTHKLRDGIATVAILAGNWLDLGTYAATYEAGKQRVAGSYAVYNCRSLAGP